MDFFDAVYLKKKQTKCSDCALNNIWLRFNQHEIITLASFYM